MKFKIKHKFFAAFIVLCCFSLSFTLVSIWMYNKKSKISEQLSLLSHVHLLSMKQYKLQQEFLLFETTNPVFFETNKSKKLKSHSNLSETILNSLRDFTNNEEANQLFESDKIIELIQQQINYQNTFNTLVFEVKKRGYKDYGLEGKMRDFAHALMLIKELNQVNILMLRRHEKDFIIRKEHKYFDEFNTLIKTVKFEILNNTNLSLNRKVELDSIINGYSNAFSKIVSTELFLVGKKNNSGLIYTLSKQHDNFVFNLATLKQNANQQESYLYDKLLIIALLTILIVFAIASIISYRIAYNLSKPIINLNTFISRYVNSKFTLIPFINIREEIDEVAQLSNNFSILVEEITNHIRHFEERVEERTLEINKQSTEILKQKAKINDQYEELVIKNDVLLQQQKKIIETHRNVTDSIKYAERIQKAIMPPKAVINKILNNGFIYFQPRDIVSGDFYFLLEKGNKVFFAIGDCTGHGVPGAFLSIIGIHALQRSLNEYNLEKPSDILNRVNKLVEQSISNHDELMLSDGMDIAFCCYDKEKNTLEYSGANLPIWIVSELDNELDFIDESQNSNLLIANASSSYVVKEIRADKQPIGYYDKRLPFTNNVIEINKGDVIYIFSDGYADQFGGPFSKKFKYNQLREMLIQIQEFSIEKQKQIIRDTLLDWKGKQEQIDDICVLGYKI